MQKKLANIQRKVRAFFDFVSNIVLIFSLFFIVFGVVFFLIDSVTKNDYVVSLNLLLSVLVAVSTLSLLSFQYAAFCEENKKENVVKAGELFFSSLLFFLFSILFVIGLKHLDSLQNSDPLILDSFKLILGLIIIILSIAAITMFTRALLELWVVLSKVLSKTDADV
ncbi:MAG: hypothetical protein ABIJ74_03505 [archaeon]